MTGALYIAHGALYKAEVLGAWEGPPPSPSDQPPGTSWAWLPSPRTPRFARIALQAGRSVRFPDAGPPSWTTSAGDLEQVGRFIRARKVTLDTIYPSGLAALHEAVLSGNLECVKLLVRYGADIHHDGYPDIARYLISLGADTDATNDDGDSPSDLVDPEYKDLVELFKGATVD
uniref:Protein phosphatase 1 regulatory subunit 27 n=1 Tax=Ornithorhynchus anatinus TaxID=9258 RepID=A0A6I8P2J6_ORNAN